MITYRDTKLSELEHEEVDENFRYLDQKSSEYVVGHIFRGPVQRVFNGQLYLLSPGVTFPFTAVDFAAELAAGNWQLLGSGTSYKGELNLTTPVLNNGTGTVGDYYKVIEAGDYDFGAGDLEFKVGDYVLYDGSVYGYYIDNNQLFSSSYVKKTFANAFEYSGSGTNKIIPFHPLGYSEIRLTNNGLISVSGFDNSSLVGNPNDEYPYAGKPIVIWNISDNNILLKHADFVNADYPLFLSNEIDIVLPPNKATLFHYDAGGLFEISFKNWCEILDVVNLQDELDLKADIAYVDALVVGLWDDRGSYDASSNAFPSTGGSGTAGAIKKGDIWTISVAGTLPSSQLVEIGDTVRALVDTPSTTPSNWAIQQNNIGYVPENSVNKATTMTGNTASNVVFLTAKAVYDWAVGKFQDILTDVNFGSFINGLNSKTTPIDADSISVVDSADSNKQKKVSLTNFKAFLKTYFDTLYSTGGGGGSQYVRMYTPSWTDGTVNTWQSWNKFANILAATPNNTLGTSSVPDATNLGDSAYFLVYDATELSQLIFSTDSSFSAKTYEIFIQSFTFSQGAGVGAESNVQTLVQETITTGGGNLYTFKDNFTIASHSLDSITGIKVSFRYTGGGGAYVCLNPQFLFKFD